MTSFDLCLDSRPAMLLTIAKHISDRATAFNILDRVDALDMEPLTSVTSSTWLRVFHYDRTKVIVVPNTSRQDFVANAVA